MQARYIYRATNISIEKGSWQDPILSEQLINYRLPPRICCQIMIPTTSARRGKGVGRTHDAYLSALNERSLQAMPQYWTGLAAAPSELCLGRAALNLKARSQVQHPIALSAQQGTLPNSLPHYRAFSAGMVDLSPAARPLSFPLRFSGYISMLTPSPYLWPR